MEQDKVANLEEIRDEEKAAEFVLGGSLVECIGGLAATVLAIMSLGLFLPTGLGAAAIIVIGLALLFDAAFLTARLPRLLAEVSTGEKEAEHFRGGITAELLGGIIATILGILCMAGIDAVMLMSYSAVVLGLALLLDSRVVSRLSVYAVHRPGEVAIRGSMTARLVQRAADFQELCGIAVIVLGIVALLGHHAALLSMVALLLIGLAAMFSGASLGWRMLRLVHH